MFRNGVEKNKGLILCLLCLLLWGCAAPERAEEATDTTVWLNMGLTFPVVESLPEGQGQSVKVILLLGQSNATGCSLTSYLHQNVQPEEYAGMTAVQIGNLVHAMMAEDLGPDRVSQEENS